MNQVTIFDELQAEHNREQGIQAADDNANRVWRLAAWRIINELAEIKVPFTSDEVIEELSLLGYYTHNLAALGPLFRKASGQDIIGKTGTTRPSCRPENHRDITVWRGI